MRRRAETVNFVPGGRWDDRSVGTNALDLSNRLDRPSMVFSAEHYAPIVHNWVCWAAPLHDPVSGTQLGVLDISTTWDRTHPIGLATVRVLARLVEQAMPRTRRYEADDSPTLSGAEPGLVLSSSARPRPASTGSGCSSTAGRPRSSRCSPCTPTGSRSTSCTRCSTATTRSPSPR